jgi:hypothetical protein
MKKVIMAMLVFVLFAGAASALTPEIIGGIRDGAAIGFKAEDQVGKNFGLRFGVEANTGKQPLILDLGGKFYLTGLGKRAYLSFGVGVAAYSGDKTSAGVSISFIINRAFDITPLFAEIGVDVVDSGRLQAQLGYKLF